MLTKDQQKLLARYLIQLLQLQAGKASPKEFKVWRKRVLAGFPDRRKKRTIQAARRSSFRRCLDAPENVDYRLKNEGWRESLFDDGAEGVSGAIMSKPD